MAAVMQLVWRALLVLVLAAVLVSCRAGGSPGSRLRSRRVKLHLDSSLSTDTIRAPSSNIAHMSLSPWTYRESLNESRVPAKIFHAECVTSGCLNPLSGVEDAALEAQPIHRQILVLYRVPMRQRRNRRGKKTWKKYEFKLGTELVSVGCTCVRPTVLPQP